MNSSKQRVKKLFIGFSALVFTGSVLYGQNSNATDSGKDTQKESQTTTKSEDKNEKLVGTYLDVAHAKENSVRYDDIIKNDIYKLQVMVANFGDASDKSKLDEVIKDHIEGKKELFKRKYLYSWQILKNTKANINAIMVHLSQKYQKQSNDILGKCAELLVDREIGIGNSADVNAQSAGKTSKKITDNKIRLMVAYDQLNMADKFKYEERMAEALTHYRLAKLHGINILIDMAISQDEKNKIKAEYKVDLLDSENRISK